MPPGEGVALGEVEPHLKSRGGQERRPAWEWEEKRTAYVRQRTAYVRQRRGGGTNKVSCFQASLVQGEVLKGPTEELTLNWGLE